MEESGAALSLLYKEMFGKEPAIPYMRSSGNDERFIQMVTEALRRGTPLTKEDYDKYYPIDPDALY